MLDIRNTNTILQIGAGGVGAPLAQHLGMICQTLFIADGDEYENGNAIRQKFATGNIGRNKAEVLAEIIPTAAPINRFVTEENIDQIIEKTDPGLIVLAVDNDEARELIFKLNGEFPILWGANEVWQPQAGLTTPKWKWNPMTYFERAEGNNEGCGVQTIHANLCAAAMASMLLQENLAEEENDKKKDGTARVFVAKTQGGEWAMRAKDLPQSQNA